MNKRRAVEPRTRFAGLTTAVIALALVSILASHATAQVGRSGLTGTAVDEGGQPAAGVEIALQPAEETAGRAQVVKTDAKGRFANRFLSSGRYVLDVKDRDRFYLKSASVDVKDAGGVLLKHYDIVSHPKSGLAAIPVQGGQITDVKLVIAPASVRAKLIRQIEGGAVSTEVSELVRLLNAGELERALALGQQLKQATTTEIPELLHLIGLTHARLNQFKEAEPLLRRAIELAPDQIDFTASLGTMLLEVARRKDRAGEDAKKEYAEAELWLGKAIAGMQPPPVALLTNHSIALEGSGQPDAALAVMEQIAKQDPANVAVRLRMAALLRRGGHVERAMAVLNSLPGGGDPRAVDSLFNIALDFYNAEDYESALAALKRAEELKSDHAQVQRLLARVYYIAGDHASTLVHLRRSIELDPKHDEANMDRELIKYLEKTAKPAKKK